MKRRSSSPRLAGIIAAAVAAAWLTAAGLPAVLAAVSATLFAILIFSIW